MSMRDVHKSFSAGLAGKASCVNGCTMTWERGEDGKQRQRISCAVTLPDGSTSVVSGLFDGQANLAVEAEKLASAFVNDQPGA